MLKPTVYVLTLALVAITAFSYRVRTGLFACPSAYDSPREYLAYCNGQTYGDYDHGAFWFGLEPDARDAAARANVLFLGSSRMQFAFSSDTTTRWFSSRSLRHYLLGFGYTENVTFMSPLLAMLKPSASAYVINVDRFFIRNETPPAAEILHGEKAALRKYIDKQRWQPPHQLICGALRLLCGDEFAFYRRPNDGHWRIGGDSQSGVTLVPGGISDGSTTDESRWKTFSSIAEEFIAELPVDRRCVLLTLVPYKGTRRAEAEAIARALGMGLVLPQLTDLQTFDGSHLDRVSAERWSTAFFDDAGARIEQCVRTPAAAAPPGPSGGLKIG